ncbi:MAG: hypothetical protein RIR70_1970 [Pseudomonadota bacterium]
MSRRFELIVFDWDGTLMDSAGHIARAIQAAARDVGLPEPSDERARHVIGLGLHEAIAHALPEAREEDVPHIAARYKHHYLARDAEISLFAGTHEMIGHLFDEARLLAVATGKSRAGLNRALQETGLKHRFHATRCVDECHSKPHPQMLLELMEELGVAPSATLMIGDTTHDLNMANNAGVAALGVTFGAHPVEELRSAKPLACLNSTGELLSWLKQNG